MEVDGFRFEGPGKGGAKVKNRIVSISLAVMLALSVGLINCGSEGVPETTKYNLTISSSEGGSVTTPGQGAGSFTYGEGEVVDLVAVAEEGYHFDNWTGDVDTVANVSSASTTITVNDNYSITANFGSGPAIPLKNPNDFVQMTIGDVDSLDPAWGYDYFSAAQVRYIYETLIDYDGNKTDEFVPVLATEWNASADGQTIRFKIRQGVKFHEGGTLTAEDVEYSFERAMVQDGYGGFLLYRPLLGLDGSRDISDNIQVTFDQIDSAVGVDGDWIVFHLVDPAWRLPFLQILCSPWGGISMIVDKEWCIANGEWDGTASNWTAYNKPNKTESYLYDHTNGTGPWKLDKWDPGVSITLVKNDNYWNGPVPFNHVITKVVHQWATRKEAILSGDADLVCAASPWSPWDYSGLEGIEDLEDIEDLTIYKNLPRLESDAFFFNMDIANNSTYIGSGVLDGNGIPTDFFTDIDVRKGFCYAFDYETFIEDAWRGSARQVGSPICEVFHTLIPMARCTVMI
jgi:peptide/nickel transport system substrate-binding protein